jgi:hypothetical protein
MASVAPTSEAIYAEITRRFGVRRLAELQDMLNELEASLADLGNTADASLEQES